MFLRYYAGTGQWALHLLYLVPTFIRYGLKQMDRNAVKAKVIARFFTGAPVDMLNARAEAFAREIIPGLIRPQAKAALTDRISGQKNGLYTLYICSASIDPYLRAFFKPLGIDNILATELESLNGVCTGRIDGYNIWGEGKVRRIYAEFEPDSVEIIEAFGDSRGDRELLDAAQASFWRPFRL